MSWIRRHATYANLTATLALFLALGGGAYAVTGNPFVGRGGVISGCVRHGGGALQIVKAGKSCPRGTIALAFSQQGEHGVAGAAGPRGAAGPQGAVGPTGPQGVTGSTGPQGVQGPMGNQGPSGALALAGQHCTPSGADADAPMAFDSSGVLACYPTVTGPDCRSTNHQDSHQQLCDFTPAGAGGVNLAGSDLRGANFAGMTLTGPLNEGSNLGGANMRWANLAGTDLTNANFAGADLEFANLTGATLTGANLAGVNWFMATCPDGSVVTNVGGSC